MKMRGIFEIIAIIVLLVLIVEPDLSYDEEAAKKYITLNDAKSSESLYLDPVNLSISNKTDITTVEYINDSSSAISLGNSSINLICHGSGAEQKADEELVLKNMKLNVYYSFMENGEKYTSVLLKKGEKVYIHIVKEYVSSKSPINSVECEYNIAT